MERVAKKWRFKPTGHPDAIRTTVRFSLDIRDEGWIDYRRYDARQVTDTEGGTRYLVLAEQARQPSELPRSEKATCNVFVEVDAYGKPSSAEASDCSPPFAREARRVALALRFRPQREGFTFRLGVPFPP